jgi:hypothetical protein
MVLTDEHRFPFSLFTESKKKGNNCTVVRTGDVTDQMDKGIGRPVLKIKGTVSANNFLDVSNILLTGQYLYVQLRVLKHATFHIDIITSADVSLRLTVSTLYADDRARFMGNSVRLPLPIHSGLMLAVLDMNKIIEVFCLSGASTKQPAATLKAIKVYAYVYLYVD